MLISGLLLGSVLILICTSCNHKKTATTTKDSVEPSDSLTHAKENADDTIHVKRPNLAYGAVNQRNEQPEDKQILSKINTKLDTALLFGIWTIDPNGPHADFVLSKNSYYIVDYDGDADTPYELKGNILKIHFKENTMEGEVVSVGKDSLRIIWSHNVDTNKYTRWKK